MRCKTIREQIEDVVCEYMNQVTTEQEMRYLLLEKDFIDKDALELITNYNIVKFLETSLAENVVNEIWRSPYATSDQIFSASTNFFLLFKFYHCSTDEEKNRRLFRGKNIKEIENHLMQFTVWRFSAKSRLIVDFFATLIITALVHYQLQLVLPMHQSVVDQVEKVEAKITDYMTLYNEI